jgi:hypothetical protein
VEKKVAAEKKKKRVQIPKPKGTAGFHFRLIEEMKLTDKRAKFKGLLFLQVVVVVALTIL